MKVAFNHWKAQSSKWTIFYRKKVSAEGRTSVDWYGLVIRAGRLVVHFAWDKDNA